LRKGGEIKPARPGIKDKSIGAVLVCRNVHDRPAAERVSSVNTVSSAQVIETFVTKVKKNPNAVDVLRIHTAVFILHPLVLVTFNSFHVRYI